MTREIFMLCVIGYYFLAMIVIAIVLFVINNKTKKKYQSQINELERQKNLVISSNILTELNKVEPLINNDDLRKKYNNWQDRFNEIKTVDIPKITDLINEVQIYFEEKDYQKQQGMLELSLMIAHVMEEGRKKEGVVFDND